uniref:Programmed cell death protein 2 C-terminal domain-containing protein n=1 Tax=Mesocestoides corti TaxID=53468 RepID=A0A5K3EZY2_MESCO
MEGDLRRHWQLSDDDLDSKSQLDRICDGPSMDDESFLQVYKSKVPRQIFAWVTILPDVGCGECRTGYFTNTGYQQQCGEPSQKLRTASLLRGRQCGVRSGRRHVGPRERHAMLVTSCDWGCNFRLCGVTRALNDAPGTESQLAHKFSVSMVAPRNGPTGEQDDEDRDT